MEKYHKNWFSNMLLMDEPFVYQGVSYRTVENFYQAMKLPKDRVDLRSEIAALNSFESKKQIRNKDKYKWREDWNQEESLKVMEYGLRQKFFPGTSWHQKLLETGDEEIVEWNNWGDLFWGVDLKTKKGENHLGKILIKLRKEYLETKLANKKKGDSFDVYIGRGSIFGNPWTHHKGIETKANFVVDTREESIDKYEGYFLDKIKNKEFRDEVNKLRNKTLGCFCIPLACHGKVILDWIFRNNV